MSARRDRSLFALSLGLQGCIVAGLVLAARSGCWPSTVVTGMALCFVPYAGALIFSRSLPTKRAVDRIALVTALCFGGALVLAPPLLSDDLYRYLWEGRLWLEGLNPYRLAPDDPALAHLPIIALTSLAGEQDMQRGIESGIDDYQIKLDRERLMAAVAKYLRESTNRVDSAGQPAAIGSQS